MEEKNIVCSLITPLFSCGAYKTIPELRTSELKGVMRYVYRISSPSELNTLAKDEAELFGGAAGSGNNTGHASPIRLLIRSEMVKDSKPLLLHKTEKKFPVSCFFDGKFEITARFNQGILSNRSGFQQTVDINWYVDLIKVSLIMCGMGKRCRKGRGCFNIEGASFKTQKDFLEWLCKALNRIGAVSSQNNGGAFMIDREGIRFKGDLSKYKRPIIHKIRLGNKMEKNQIDNYLWAVDEMSHKLKERKLENDDKKTLPIGITGFAGSKGKLASPLLIRIVQLEGGFYPLYIFLKNVSEENWFDRGCFMREKFIYYVENPKSKGVRQ
ncbi:hypothetical protein GPL15_16680 [Clostridium sp. MCC353]|uniref:RAMP superfamily CRISPR-associated protein n=1 Tax=Clostridium sp. MCC353 TaxID=2592646 RepID=UPI001C021E80|nr:RAMP superfamily CRISPR-associated protein [Clostridium sp. MCC353]MBT9778137.1 hypothetical protein [Clostridium sp. MCC353]